MPVEAVILDFGARYRARAERRRRSTDSHGCCGLDAEGFDERGTRIAFRTIAES